MYGEISRDKWTKFGEIRYRHYCTCGWGSVPVGTRPALIDWAGKNNTLRY